MAANFQKNTIRKHIKKLVLPCLTLSDLCSKSSADFALVLQGQLEYPKLISVPQITEQIVGAFPSCCIAQTLNRYVVAKSMVYIPPGKMVDIESLAS